MPREFPDVVYGKAGDRELHLDMVLPAKTSKPYPCVVWFHGGGWRTGDRKDNQAAWLAREGYVAASVDYRLSDEALFPAQIHDCKAAIRFLRANAEKYEIDPSRIGVWGLSAGGHLAALMGSSAGVQELEGNSGSPDHPSDVQAVCDFFGPADLTMALSPVKQEIDVVAQVLGGTPEEKPELARLASPVSHVTPGDPPVLIVHGDKDPLLTIKHSERLCEALKNAGVEVEIVRVRNAGHGFPESGISPTRPQIDKMVLGFFNKHLK